VGKRKEEVSVGGGWSTLSRSEGGGEKACRLKLPGPKLCTVLGVGPGNFLKGVGRRTLKKPSDDGGERQSP